MKEIKIPVEFYKREQEWVESVMYFLNNSEGVWKVVSRRKYIRLLIIPTEEEKLFIEKFIEPYKELKNCNEKGS